MNQQDAMDKIVEALEEWRFSVHRRPNEFKVWSAGFQIATLQYHGGNLRVITLTDTFYYDPEEWSEALQDILTEDDRFFEEETIIDLPYAPQYG